MLELDAFFFRKHKRVVTNCNMKCRGTAMTTCWLNESANLIYAES